jgi:hypothetical protein
MQLATTTTNFDSLDEPLNANQERYAGDNKLYVDFSRRPRLHPGKSNEAGRAVYEEVDYITIHVPGDKSSVIERPVSQMDAERFADRYAKWRAGQAEAVVGTPLSALPGMTPAKVEEYKFFKIVTVEQMAEANDNLGQKFMSFHQDKNRAKAFIEVAQNNAPIERLNNELQKRDAEIDELRSMIEALQAQSNGRRRVAAAEVAVQQD